MIRSICLAIGTLVFVTNGETLLVPSQYPTIQEAANAADPGDVIQIAAGTYQEFDILCSDVTILGETGNNGTPVTRIDSSNLGRSLICSGSQISIQNIEFENFVDNAIQCEGLEEAVVQNCSFKTNDGPYGGLSISARSSVVLNCNFERSSLYFNGFGDLGNVQISGCHFNKSGSTSFSPTNIENCTFSDLNSFQLLSDCTFTSLRTIGDSLCELSQLGGGGRFVCDDLIGAFTISCKDGELKNSTLEGAGPNQNYTPAYVVYLSTPSTFTVSNCTISNNTVSGTFNSAVVNSGTTPILIEDSIVCGNTPLNIYGPYSLVNSFLLPNCGSFEGSCCSASECLTVTEEECTSLGGSWRGTNVPCSSVSCAPPEQFGTCCVNDESIKLFESDCNRIGGTFEGSVPDGFVCPPSLTCEGDITNNGDVGLPDLIAVLSNWGPCPG